MHVAFATRGNGHDTPHTAAACVLACLAMFAVCRLHCIIVMLLASSHTPPLSPVTSVMLTSTTGVSHAQEESSEYETDSEDEATAGRRLFKPSFVPKVARDTIAEREALQAEEEKLKEAEHKRLQERKVQGLPIVHHAIEWGWLM